MYATVNLNIRKSPSTSGTWVEMYEKGEEVEVYSIKNGWAKTPDGWCSASYLSDLPLNTTTETLSERTVTAGISFEEKIEEFSVELVPAEYAYSSDTLFITISKNEYEDSSYYLAHIIVSDPSQIKTGLANGSYGEDLQFPTEAAEETGAALLTNGSMFAYINGEPYCGGVYIYNGQVVSGETTNGQEICLKSDGTLYSPTSGITSSSLIDTGTIATIWTAEPELISNGEPASLTNLTNAAYPRMVYGMVEPCEYYIVLADASSYEEGLTYTQLQIIFMKLGCTWARPFNGGETASLVYDGELINNPISGKEVSTADYFYFAN